MDSKQEVLKWVPGAVVEKHRDAEAVYIVFDRFTGSANRQMLGAGLNPVEAWADAEDTLRRRRERELNQFM